MTTPAQARRSSHDQRHAGITFRPSAVGGPRGHGGAVKSVGSFVPRLTRKAFEKYGFSAATLLTDWAQIAGPGLAAYTAPERLKWPRLPDAYGDVDAAATGRPGATLILRVDGGRALDVEYRRRELIERINGYFGYRAVADLRILQAPVAGPTPRQVIAPCRPQPRIKPAPELSAVADDGLRDALERMQAGIAARRAPAAG